MQFLTGNPLTAMIIEFFLGSAPTPLSLSHTTCKFGSHTIFKIEDILIRLGWPQNSIGEMGEDTARDIEEQLQWPLGKRSVAFRKKGRGREKTSASGERRESRSFQFF